MRVLFINRFFYPDQSATAQLLTELAEDLDSFGMSVTIIAGRVDYLGSGHLLPSRGSHKGIEIIRVRSTRLDGGGVFGRLVDYLSFYASAGWAAFLYKSYDCLVVLSDPPLLSVLAVVLRMFKRCKGVCWLQDIFPEIAVRARVMPKGIVARLLRQLGAWSIRHMDRTVVIGRCMQQHIQKIGIQRERLCLIPNWADGFYIHPVNREENWFVHEHGLGNHFVVMYSGNFGVVHESETILDMVRAGKSIEEIRFCFIGKGYHRDRFAEMAKREEWKHVLFFPYQDRDMMRYALAGGDVHLVSLRRDMNGLSVPSKIYGIMAAGRPIIFVGPDESEAAAVIREADCGQVVSPGRGREAYELMQAYYRDRTLVERHGRNARAYFESNCDRRLLTHRFCNVLREI